MYVTGFVIPVPEAKLADYMIWSENAAKLLMEFGCLEVVETCEDNVPDGHHTDFRKAVDLKPGEKVIFSWQKWPDKAHVDAVERAMRSDPRFDPPGEIPFDQRRLILGGFVPIFTAAAGTE